MVSGPMCLSCGKHHPANESCNKPAWHDCHAIVVEQGSEWHVLPCDNPQPKCTGCPSLPLMTKEADSNGA